MEWPEIDLAYLAGIIDGEGHIRAKTHRHKGDGRIRREVFLTINQSNQHFDLIVYLQKTFSIGAIYRQGANAHRWQVSRGAELQAILEAVLPYLVLKNDQANEALKLLEERQRFNHMKSLGYTFAQGRLI